MKRTSSFRIFFQRKRICFLPF